MVSITIFVAVMQRKGRLLQMEIEKKYLVKLNIRLVLEVGSSIHIMAQYDSVGEFCCGFAKATKNGVVVGFINPNGDLIYDDATPFGDDKLCVCKDGLWGVINSVGEYIIEHDNGVYRGKCTEVVFGNGIVYGGNLHFVEQVNVKDGIGCLRVLFPKRGFGRLKMMLNAIHSNFAKLDTISEVSMTQKVCIRRADGAEIAVNQDGEIVRGVREWTVEIVPNALPFVIPKGVMLHE